MNMPPTKTEREIYARVSKIQNPIEECQRRWPTFRFEERQERWPSFHPTKAGEPKAYYVRALWHGDGHDRGLDVRAGRHPTASREEIAEAKKLIAFRALLNAEYRKGEAST